jgi:hypothetical protein
MTRSTHGNASAAPRTRGDRTANRGWDGPCLEVVNRFGSQVLAWPNETTEVFERALTARIPRTSHYFQLFAVRCLRDRYITLE